MIHHTKMIQKCQALTKGLKACKGSGGDEGLCAVHKDWYDNNNWFNEVVKIATPLNKFGRIKRICLNDKAVIQPGNTLESLLEQGYLDNSDSQRDRHRYIIIYNICTEFRKIIPSKCPSIWIRELLLAISLIGTYQGLTVQHPTRMNRERYLSHIKNSFLPYLYNESIEQFMMFLEQGIAMMNISLECWKDIIDTLVPWLDQISITFGEKELLRKALMTNIWNSVRVRILAFEIMYPIEKIVDYAFETIDKIKVEQRKIMNDVFYPLKEELMMTYFHPMRIQRLIYTYGLDVIDNL